MLHIFFGSLKDELRIADGWFDNQLPDEYYITDFSKNVIRDIDKSEVVSEHLVLSPILGGIPMSSISSGAKGIITMMYTNKVINLVSLGDNCIHFIKDIVDTKGDLTVSSVRFVDFYKYGYTGEIHILNDDSYVSDSITLFEDKWLEFQDVRNGEIKKG